MGNTRGHWEREDWEWGHWGRSELGTEPRATRKGAAKPMSLSLDSGWPRAQQPHGQLHKLPGQLRWILAHQTPIPTGSTRSSPWLQHSSSPGGCSWPPGSLPRPRGYCRQGCPRVGTPCTALPGDSSGQAHPPPGRHRESRAVPGPQGENAGGSSMPCTGPHHCRQGMAPGHPWRWKPLGQVLIPRSGGMAAQSQP